MAGKEDLGNVIDRLYVKHKTEIKKVRLTDIEFGERFRQNYGDLDELQSSILANGLITPITLLSLAEPNAAGKHYVLIAGGRRFTCFLVLQKSYGKDFDWIPANIYPSETTEEQLRVMELCENLHRKEMTWLEEINIKLRVHRSLTKKHGVARTNTLGGHSVRDTAALFGVTHGSFSIDLKIAELAEIDPVIRECANKAEARRYYESLEKKLLREEKAKEILADLAIIEGDRAEMKFLSKEEKESLDETTLALLNKIEEKFHSKRLDLLKDSFCLADAFETIKTKPSDFYDLIELDPPYAIDYVSVRKGSDSAESEGYIELTPQNYMDKMVPLLEDCYRILSPNGWLIFWHAITPFNHVLFDKMLEMGFQGRMQPALWVKPTGQSNNPKYHLGSCYECFWYLRKGAMLIEKPRNNTFFYPTINPNKKVHITEKPIELLTDILKTFTHPYSQVYVPFLGSGNTILAAWNAVMKAEGCDLTDDHKAGFILKLADREQKAEFTSYQKGDLDELSSRDSEQEKP